MRSKLQRGEDLDKCELRRFVRKAIACLPSFWRRHCALLWHLSVSRKTVVVHFAFKTE